MRGLDDYLTNTPAESPIDAWYNDCPASKHGCPWTCADCDYGPGEKYDPGRHAERVCGDCKHYRREADGTYCIYPTPMWAPYLEKVDAYEVADDCECFMAQSASTERNHHV